MNRQVPAAPCPFQLNRHVRIAASICRAALRRSARMKSYADRSNILSLLKKNSRFGRRVIQSVVASILGIALMLVPFGAINPGLYQKLPYDPIKDFAPVSAPSQEQDNRRTP